MFELEAYWAAAKAVLVENGRDCPVEQVAYDLEVAEEKSATDLDLESRYWIAAMAALEIAV